METMGTMPCMEDVEFQPELGVIEGTYLGTCSQGRRDMAEKTWSMQNWDLTLPVVHAISGVDNVLNQDLCCVDNEHYLMLLRTDFGHPPLCTLIVFKASCSHPLL